MAQRLFDRPGNVHQVYTGLFLHGRLIGFLTMQHKSASSDSLAADNTLCSVGSYGDLNTTSDVTPGNDLHSTTSAHSETVIDDGDPKFKIRYILDTARIMPAGIFTAFMDGLATAAEFDSTGTGAFVNAVAASGKCAINVGLQSQFNWALLVQTLALVFIQNIFPQKLFYGMDFDVIYEDSKVGEGFVLAMSSPLHLGSNVTRVAASEK